MSDVGRVLVVDDIMQNIQLIGATLNRGGYDVFIAHSGEEALEKAQQTNPDLILLDVMMPGIDGYETCRQLKQIFKLKDIPVIFLTALDGDDSLLKGFEVGGVDYVSKPFKPAELMARVKTHVKLKKTLEENSSLRGLIPICAQCKKIRDDSGFWESVESYISKHSAASFSHSLCSTCEDDLYGGQPWYAKKKEKDRLRDIEKGK